MSWFSQDGNVSVWLGGCVFALACLFLVWRFLLRGESVEALRLRCVRSPRNFTYRQDYAHALYCAGRLPHAELEFGRALRLDPENAQCRFYLGSLLLMKGDKDAAILELEQAISLSPMYAEAHNTLGTAREKRGDLVGAQRSYIRAVQLDKNLANAHFNLARIYAMCSDSANAVKHLARAITLADVYKYEAKTCTDFDNVCRRPEFNEVVFEAA
ncbi:MAG TPA: tetratricopeptide repeat protein [Fimbriimonadaceae bacterium]|jgi:Flp pilus assembly protein TadD